MTPALAGGALRVLGGAHIFPVNYAWKIFFTALWGAGAPTAPPGYAYVMRVGNRRKISQFFRPLYN